MVASTSSTPWAGLAFPLATAPVSSVNRWGKYHSVPSTFCIGYPENMVAKRVIGVSAPAPFQPWTGPWADETPAEVRLGRRAGLAAKSRR